MKREANGILTVFIGLTGCLVLLDNMIDSNLPLETSGALTIENINSKVSRVIDLKPPVSNESHRK